MKVNGSIKEGERLREIRSFFGLSQEVMAERFGLNQPAYSHFEQGFTKVDERFLKALQFEFNINPVWFRTGEGYILNAKKEEDLELVKLRIDLVDKFNSLDLDRKLKLLSKAEELRIEQELEDS